MALVRLDHVQLAMPRGGENAARAFYRDVLGLREEAKPVELEGRGGCWFRSGPLRIHLGVDTAFRPARKAHPAFRCDDLAALAAALSAAGAPICRDGTFEGADRIYSEDPFGNRLEFIATS